jgi:flagellar hook-basal body complex protein FliE
MTPIGVSPATAAAAYRSVDAGAEAEPAAPATPSFGDALQHAIESAVQLGEQAETRSIEAIKGEGNITDVITAVAKAQLALQTAVNIRDRVVQTYQQIMSMPI